MNNLPLRVFFLAYAAICTSGILKTKLKPFNHSVNLMIDEDTSSLNQNFWKSRILENFDESPNTKFTHNSHHYNEEWITKWFYYQIYSGQYQLEKWSSLSAFIGQNFSSQHFFQFVSWVLQNDSSRFLLSHRTSLTSIHNFNSLSSVKLKTNHCWMANASEILKIVF